MREADEMITPEDQVLSGHCLQVCVGEVLAATFKSVNNSREYGTITYTLKFMVSFFFNTKNKQRTVNCVDWLQSLKQFFINVSYHILVASLTLMALS